MTGSRSTDDPARPRARGDGNRRGRTPVRRDGPLRGQRPVRRRFSPAHGPCRGGEILDVGTGTARIPIALARPTARLASLALDLAETMLAQAAVNIAAAGLSHRIRCHHGDAKSLLESFGEGRFEGVISNTIVHHIPDPEPALRTMARLVATGGTLMVRDLARPDSHGEIAPARGDLTPDRKPRRRGHSSRHRSGAALTLEEIRAIVERLGLPPSEVAMTSDRHWTWIWHR